MARKEKKAGPGSEANALLFPSLAQAPAIFTPIVPEGTTAPLDTQEEGEWLPPHCGEAVSLPTPDFSDPDRSKTCLELDFPILPVNAVAFVEGNAGKPIYAMSKWWARRRSSVFRSMLIAAATEAPDRADEAAHRAWDAYYANHQLSGNFRRLRVLDPFMGGGTTLVEGARLGFQVVGCDLNPVAWFVCQNELAGSDPDAVKALFDHIEAEVKPQIQPFYTTTCPRGHKGRWIDIDTDLPVEVDALTLRPDERKRLRWNGPEIIYTFWAKHGHCQKPGCGHRTPIFSDPVVAIKTLSADFLSATCSSCSASFRIYLGETRMAPGTPRVVVGDEGPFTETSVEVSRLFSSYGKGPIGQKLETIAELRERIQEDPAFHCPTCGAHAYDGWLKRLDAQRKGKTSEINRKGLGIQKTKISMSLLVDPVWFEGSSGLHPDGRIHLGGTCLASSVEEKDWLEARLEGLGLIEVRGALDGLEGIIWEGRIISLTRGTVPAQASFACQKCGLQSRVMEATQALGVTAPFFPYVLQCYCPECAAQGEAYSGRFFKATGRHDINAMVAACTAWEMRGQEGDLSTYWPREEIEPAHMTHQRQPMPQHGYTHWWRLFNSRQLLGHALLLRAITEAPDDCFPLDVRMQALGAFQQYLRNQNSLCFYHMTRDCLAPALSNSNYHPKSLPIEVGVFSDGYGPWKSTLGGIIEGLRWSQTPWEVGLNRQQESGRYQTGDPIPLESALVLCGSSTDLNILGDESIDLVISDPPFGDNLYYGDLADFFYVWLRIPLQRWYAGQPQADYWRARRTPRAVEAIDNPLEHPDDREVWEAEEYLKPSILAEIRTRTGDTSLEVGDENPLYRAEPSLQHYRDALTGCWLECHRVLKPGGLLAFTFHHKDNIQWVEVLRSLFDAGFVLEATYPVRSDETKGENAAFGAKTIEYDIIHVCRKREGEPERASSRQMLDWVRDESARLKQVLDVSHRRYATGGLPENDLRIVLIGKSLEFYSRHHGAVINGRGEAVSIADALSDVDTLLEELLSTGGLERLSSDLSAVDSTTRLFVRLFGRTPRLTREEYHKRLRGTAWPGETFVKLGWCRIEGGEVYRIPPAIRAAALMGRLNALKRHEYDQAMYCIAACLPGSGRNLHAELDRALRARAWKPAAGLDALLRWFAENDQDADVRRAASDAATLVDHWQQQAQKPTPEDVQLPLLEAAVRPSAPQTRAGKKVGPDVE